MKENRLSKILAIGAACALAAGPVLAQETATTTTSTDTATGASTTSTTTSSGMFAAAPSGDYFTFRASTGADPTRYYYSNKTVVVDPSGKTVEWSSVRPDMPATVYYTKQGDRMVVTKVMLSQPVVTEKESTTTTTTHP